MLFPEGGGVCGEPRVRGQHVRRVHGSWGQDQGLSFQEGEAGSAAACYLA